VVVVVVVVVVFVVVLAAQQEIARHLLGLGPSSRLLEPFWAMRSARHDDVRL